MLRRQRYHGVMVHPVHLAHVKDANYPSVIVNKILLSLPRARGNASPVGRCRPGGNSYSVEDAPNEIGLQRSLGVAWRIGLWPR